jgi:hypothetical protein
MKENIEQIARSIQNHVKQEISQGFSNQAFARAKCEVDRMERVFWLTNAQNVRGMRMTRDFTGSGTIATAGIRTTLESDGQPIYKNTKVGEILTKAFSGTYYYTTLNNIKRQEEHELTIYNRATYNTIAGKVMDFELYLDSQRYRYQNLAVLLKTIEEEKNALRQHNAEIIKLQEEQKRLEEEKRLAAEMEAKAAKEIQERLEAERKQKEEEERKCREKVAEKEKAILETQLRIKSVQSFMRKGSSLRSQHLLDAYQEDAKRSHIYDGVPIVIEGGPGTGKTTTVIQRLMFLLSDQALTEYVGDGSVLTKSQIEELTDPSTVMNHWVFFSPTKRLLSYLRKNMSEEGLIVTDENTRILPEFRQLMMRKYDLFNPDRKGPFRDYKPKKDEEVLVVSPTQLITEFEQFAIEYALKVVHQRMELDTTQYDWHPIATRIKTICSNFANIKNVETVMRLFNALYDKEYTNVKTIDEELRELLRSEGSKVSDMVLDEEEVANKVHELFTRWKKDKVQAADADEEELSEEEEAEQDTFSAQEFKNQLYIQCKTMLKQLALRKIDSKIKLSKRNQELFDLVEPFVDEDIRLDEIGNKAWFVRNFASLCRGVESNLIRQIPAIYKAYRKNLLTIREKEAVETESGLVMKPTGIYKDELLDQIMKKDSNKHLHPDEQNLVLGFINNLLFEINRRSKTRFQKMKHKYYNAYLKNVKAVIGIDEATDYSILDYYLMASFKHYDYSSITLCGDLMQGLNAQGISSWDELRKAKILPNLEVKSLDISYRQLPTLLDMAKEMYKDDQKVYPSYQSDFQKDEKEPAPLLFVSDDEDEKAEWIADRIRDIFRTYNELPSVAIFVGDEVDIDEFIERINDLDMLDGIELKDCSGDREIQSKDMVRVFRLSEVKGMEFEAVFFYDIDATLRNHSLSMMRRFLYVGISRAASHLAATITSTEGQEGIMKYFNMDVKTW